MGFALMFGAGNALFGTWGFFLIDSGKTFDSLSWTVVPLEAKFFFQLVFCATAATIVSGSMKQFFTVKVLEFLQRNEKRREMQE